MSECINFPVEGQIFIAENGILGKRKRIIYLEPKIGNELEFEKPLTKEELRDNMSFFESYSVKVRNLTSVIMRNNNIFFGIGLVIDHKISVYW